MSLFKPSKSSRVGVVANHDNNEISLSSMVVAIEASPDSPFWIINFGRKIENGEDNPLDDRGSMILEEEMIRDIIQQIDFEKKGEER